MGMKMKTAIFLGLMVNILLLTGCAGNSGGGASTPATPTVRPIITNTLRTFVNGDNIQYSMTGTVFTGGVNLTLTGTASYAITTNASPLDPTNTVRSVATLAMNGTYSNGTPFSSNGLTYFSQDAYGSINKYGDSMSLWITSPASGFITSFKSPFNSPYSWINTYTQQNGDKSSDSKLIVGKATATTGMGTFEVYQVQTDSTTTLAAGGSDISTETDYFVPSIGMVKIVLNATSTDAFGIVTTSKFTLVASTTNIAF